MLLLRLWAYYALLQETPYKTRTSRNVKIAFFEIAVRAISGKIYSKILQGGQIYAYYQPAH